MYKRDSAEEGKRRDRSSNLRPQSANNVIRYRGGELEQLKQSRQPVAMASSATPTNPQPEEKQSKLKKKTSKEPSRKINNLMSKTSQAIYTPPEDLQRLLPKNIYQDKETLYAQLLHHKQLLNLTTEENVRLKTRITNLERQKLRMLKAIDDEDTRPTNQKLKQTVNELLGRRHDPIKNIRLENQKLKRMIKFTDIQEIQKQNKGKTEVISALYEQLERLKQLLQRQMSSDESKKLTEVGSNVTSSTGVNSTNSIRLDRRTSLDGQDSKIKEQLKSLKAEMELLKQSHLAVENQQLKNNIERLERQLLIEKTVVKGLTQKLQVFETKKTEAGKVELTTSPVETINPTPLTNSALVASTITTTINLGRFLSYKFAAQRYTLPNILQMLSRVPKYNKAILTNILLGQPFFVTNDHHRQLFISNITKNSTVEPTLQAIQNFLSSIVPPYFTPSTEEEEELYVSSSEQITLNYSQLCLKIKQRQITQGSLDLNTLTNILKDAGLSDKQVFFIVGQISFFSDDLETLNCYALFDKFYIPTCDMLSRPLEHSHIEEVDEMFEQSMPNDEYV